MGTNSNIYSGTNMEGSNDFESFDSAIYIDHLQALKNEVDSFTELDVNWDGYGGTPLLETIAFKAKQFISILDDTFVDFISDLYPNPHGTITIEWENKKKGKLSLEIGENNFSYFIESTNAPVQFFEGNDLPDYQVFKSQVANLFEDERPRIFIL